MADEIDKQPQPDSPAETPPGAKSPEAPGPVPYDRFKEVNEKSKELEKRLAQYEQEKTAAQKAQEEADSKRLEEQQKWQELAEKRGQKAQEAETGLTAATERLGRYETALTSFLQAEKAAIPDIFHDLLGKMDVVEQLEWIAANKAKLTIKTPNGIPATPPPKGKGELSPEERRRQAARTV
jgi:hypothetical protein